MTNKNLPSLILEGGTFRTIFTSGVLDAFLEHDLHFPYVIGISAGAINACSYVSKQKERTYRVFTTYRNDPRYMGVRNFISDKSYFGLDFSYNVIPNELDLFDWETFRNFDGRVEFGVTNAYSGKAEYWNAKEMDEECTLLKATCALPMFFPEILLNDVPYYDGGLAAPIPVERAEQLGFYRHIFVLTRPKGYRKELEWQGRVAIRSFSKKYPRLAKQMLNRADEYNQTIDYIEKLEAEGRAFIFRPDYSLRSFEKKPEIFEQSYKMGYKQGHEQMERLKAFLGRV